jgi:hypothetical protein
MAVESILSDLQDTSDTVKDLPEPVFEVYEDKSRNNEWRWRLRAENTQIIAVSGEGYVTKQGCENGIDSVKTNAPKAKIVYV